MSHFLLDWFAFWPAEKNLCMIGTLYFRETVLQYFCIMLYAFLPPGEDGGGVKTPWKTLNGTHDSGNNGLCRYV